MVKKLLLSLFLSLTTFAYEIVIDESLSKKDIDYMEYIIKTWEDKDTGLIWQVNIDKKRYDWNNAKKYCEDLTLDGYSNWKLPTKDELKTIMTKTSYKNNKSYSGKTYIKKPLLKSMSMKYQFFWSSTSKNSSRALYLNFLGGNDLYYNKSGLYYVRCVVGRQ